MVFFHTHARRNARIGVPNLGGLGGEEGAGFENKIYSSNVARVRGMKK